MAFDLQQFMLGLGGGMMGDPMLPFKMKNMQQAMQQKMEELKMEKEKNDLMAKQMQIHMKVLEHQLKTGQTEQESLDKPFTLFQNVPGGTFSPVAGIEGGEPTPSAEYPERIEEKKFPFSRREAIQQEKALGEKGFRSMLGIKDKEEVEKPIVLPKGGRLFTPQGKELASNVQEEGKKPLSDIGKLANDFGIDISKADEQTVNKLVTINSTFKGKDKNKTITGNSTDASGNVSAFVIDTVTGEKNVYNLGPIGKPQVEKPEDLTPAQKAVQERADRSAAAGLRKEFLSRPIVKAYDEFEIQHDTMKEAYDESKKTKDFLATDQAIIMTFNKMMDLKGTVRVEEYNRTPQDMSLYNRAISIASKWKYGGVLNPTDRKAIMDMSNRFNNALKKRYNKEVKDYRELSTMQSFDPNLVAKEKKMEGTETPSPSNPLTPKPSVSKPKYDKLTNDEITKTKVELISIKNTYPELTQDKVRHGLEIRNIDPSLFEDIIGGFPK